MILSTLASYATRIAKITIGSTLSDRLLDPPEDFHKDKDFDVYRQFDNYEFLADTVSVDNLGNGLYPKRTSIKAWEKILQNGKIRCHNRDPNIKFMPYQDIVPYNDDMPSMPDTRLKTAVSWKNSCDTVHILNRSRDNFLKSRTKKGVTGFNILKATTHSNDCFCVAGTEANNYEYCYFSTICLPSRLSVARKGPYEVLDKQDRMFLNPTMIFFSPVNSQGLITPVLSMRQPLSLLTRDKFRRFMPPFSRIDLSEDQTMLADILATFDTGVSSRFFRNFIWEGGLADSRNNWFRHPPLSRQMKSSDMKARNDSMDWVLSNSVHCTPFWGSTICNFCHDLLFITDIQNILNHMATKHKILLSSVFSCPACLELTLHSWKSFREHFRNVHNPSLGLLTVFCETAVSLRLSVGFALYNLSCVYEITGLENSSSMTAEITAAGEPKEHISISGGYTDLGQTTRENFDSVCQHLGNSILDLRRQLIPDGDLSYNMDSRKNKRTRPAQRTPSCSEDSESDNERASPSKKENYYLSDFIKFDTQKVHFNPKKTSNVYSSQPPAAKEKSSANDTDLLQKAIDEISYLHVPQPGTSQVEEGSFTTVTRGKKKIGSSTFVYPTDRILAEAEKLLDSEDQMQQ